MRRWFAALLLTGAMAPQGLAAKPANPPVRPEAQDVAVSLDAFVEQALAEGLLRQPDASRKGEAASDAEDSGARHFSCPDTNPFDFSAQSELSGYAALLETRKASDGSASAAVALARNYIALDLHAEALMQLRAVNGTDAEALRVLAAYLDGRTSPDMTTLRALANCHAEAQLWTALPLLQAGEPAAVQMLSDSLTTYRRLPLYLRDRYAFLAVPALDALDARPLAKKLLAAFTEEELARSSQLNFARAVLELSADIPEAEEKLQRFIVVGRFQAQSIEMLTRHGRIVHAALRATLMADAIASLEQTGDVGSLGGDFDFLITELSARSEYAAMMKLAAIPAMQEASLSTFLRQEFSRMLARDLGSADPAQALSAIELLARRPPMLGELPDSAKLFENAARRASEFGLLSLAYDLARDAHDPLLSITLEARLAARKGDHARVVTLARSSAADSEIAELGVVSALVLRRGADVAALLPKVTLAPETIVNLVERDASTGAWMLPGSILEAALRLEDPDLRTRAARALSLRPTQAPAVNRVALDRVPDALARNRERLATLPGEGN